MRGGGGLFDFFSRQLTRIDPSLSSEYLHGLTVWIEIIALGEDRSIPVKSEPTEYLYGFVDRMGFDSRSVQIFESETERPAVLPGHRPVDEERSRITEVERAGG